jgi:hypothetical protein
MAIVQSNTWWSYRREGNVGIWEIKDWERLFEAEIDEAERHYQKTAGQQEITATLVVFESVGMLDSETQEYMTDAWSQLAQAVDLEKTAYVADGIAAMAVQSNVEAPETDLRAFESVDDALSWASE